MHLSSEDFAFHQRLGHLLNHVEEEEFWSSFSAFLRENIKFDSWVVMIFQKENCPLIIHEGYTTSIEDDLFKKYIRKYYIDDPFYQFSIKNDAFGVYRLNEISSKDFETSIYFHEYFRNNVVEDEIQLLAPYKQGGNIHGILSLSLGSQNHFTKHEYGLLVLMSAWLLPLIKIATKNTLEFINSSEKNPNNIYFDKNLREISNINLTDREIETASLLLSGQSTKGIAAHLGISPETVKVHRRHLYEKMGVTSQAEFFAHCLPSRKPLSTPHSIPSTE